MEKNYKIKLANYLKFDKNSERIEYSWLEDCGVLIDGGIIENKESEDFSDEEALKMILDSINISKHLEIQEVEEEIKEINVLVFKDEESKIPLTRSELAEIYWNGDKEKIKKYGYPVERMALYSAECKCNGHGRFVLEETPKEIREKRRVQYIRCKNCGQRSYL